MKKLSLLFVLIAVHTFGQQEEPKIKSGTYGELRIAVDPYMKRITGYYENYTGWDEETKSPRFSCIFYIEGKLENDKAEIKTYHPLYKSEVKWGQFQQTDSNLVSIKLFEEHGGCGNVQHFTDEAVKFTLDKSENWIQIRYADKDEVYFYANNNSPSPQSSYLVKGDIVYIDRTINTSAHCTYFGKKKKTGWIRIEDLNRVD